MKRFKMLLVHVNALISISLFLSLLDLFNLTASLFHVCSKICLAN